MATTAPLTLVVAPSGYGKTWALLEFARSSTMPVTWYGIEADDTDPAVFLSGLTASLCSAFQGISLPRPQIQDASPSGLIAAATELLDAIEDRIPQLFVTILDDYHLIDGQDDISALMEFILRHLPENWRLVISSRHAPRLRLIKLIAGGEVAGLGKADLAFTIDEVHALLELAGADPHPDLSHEIHRATDGWPLAVALTARSFEGRPHSLSLFRTLGRHALDMLIWDVLEQFPDWRRDIVRAAVFDELGQEELRCAAGDDRASSLASVLSELPMVTESAPGRFSMHDMLRASLLRHLKENEPLAYVELHRQAAQLYLTKLPEAAIRHFLEAEAFQEAANLLETMAPKLFLVGQWRTIVELGRRLPAWELAGRPTLSLTLAKALYQLGFVAEAVDLVSQAVAHAEAGKDSAVLACALAERSVAHRLNGLLHRAKEDAERALELATPGSSVQASALRNLGIVLGQLGQPDVAEQHLERARSTYTALNDRYSAALCLTDLANLFLAYRRTLEARAAFTQAMVLWTELGNQGNLALALNGAGVAANLSGDWRSAEAILSEALERARQSGYARAAAYALASLADLRMDQGDFQAAAELFAQAQKVSTEAGEAYLTLYALDGLARAARANGNLEEAAQWNARAFQKAAELGMAQELAAVELTAAMIQAERGNLETASDTAERLLKESSHLMDLRRLCLARVLQAHIHFKHRRQDEALDSLRRLVSEGGSGMLGSAELSFASEVLDHAATRAAISGLPGRPQVREPASKPTGTEERPQPPTIKVKTLGPIEVTVNGTPVAAWEATSARDLFLYLVHTRKPERRETLMELFWPEQPPGKAASALQSALYRVRRLLGKETVRHRQGWYAVEVPVQTDVDEFHDLLARAERTQDPAERKKLLEEALALYRGDYLEDIYSLWPEDRRRELRELRFEALKELATLYYDEGKYPQTIALCRQAINFDPYRESFHRMLMRALVRSGDRAGAVQHYRELQELLRQDLSLQPEPTTQLLFDKIARGEL